MNRFEMFNAMVNGKTVILNSPCSLHPYKGVILSMQLEDGSGHNFIVVIRGTDGINHKVFMRSPK